MAGRAKVKLYHYNLDGKRLGVFESRQELCDKYYKGAKYPLFSNKYNKNVHLLPDATCVTKQVINKSNLVKLIRRFDAPYLVDKYNEYKPIEILNFDKIKIAEFYNMNIASKMLNISIGHLHYLIKKNVKTVYGKHKIYARFKEI